MTMTHLLKYHIIKLYFIFKQVGNSKLISKEKCRVQWNPTTLDKKIWKYLKIKEKIKNWQVSMKDWAIS